MENEDAKTYPILESTGYSWSGIADYLDSNSFNAKGLLHEINIAYNEAKLEEDKLKSALDRVKSRRAALVSCFIHAHRKLVGDPLKKLVFDQDKEVVIITILEENKINYESFIKTI